MQASLDVSPGRERRSPLRLMAHEINFRHVFIVAASVAFGYLPVRGSGMQQSHNARRTI